MKLVTLTILTTFTASLAFAGGEHGGGNDGETMVLAQAETEGNYTKGVEKKIKSDAGTVTIVHEELVDLGMPAMTMVFRADDTLIAQLSEGEAIEFLADRVNGKLTVTGLK